jgi:hypothetical protein
MSAKVPLFCHRLSQVFAWAYPLSYRPEGVGSSAGLITRSVSEARPFPEG